MRRVLRNRDARLLLAGQMLSVFGDRAMFLALGVWVKTLTGSSAAAGLVFFAYSLPGLVSPLFGALVDRVRARPLMIVLNLAGAAVLVPLIGVHGRGQLWLIYLVTLLYGAIGWLFYSAQSAYLTRLLPPELLGDANAALQTTGEGMRLFAPLVGAGLFAAFGGPTVAALDAATFVVAALTLAVIAPSRAPPGAREHHLRAQVAAGVRHSPARPACAGSSRPPASRCSWSASPRRSCSRSSSTGCTAGRRSRRAELGAGPGGVAGGIVAGGMVRRHGDGRVIGLGMLLFAVGETALLVPHVAVVLVGFAVAGGGVSWAVVGYSPPCSCARRPRSRAASTRRPTSWSACPRPCRSRWAPG